jgi:DNA-binding MarR family transcriptional regulator
MWARLPRLLTDEGRRRLLAANPAARALEAAIEDGFTADQIATVKTWLVEAAKRL